MGRLLLPLLMVGAAHAAAAPCLIVEEAQDGWKSLTSPDYPKQFNPNTQCIYRITAPKGERIELEFVDFLFITTDNEDCHRQSLSLRDPEVDEIIGKYCGNTKPPNYSTMGDEVFMLLNSESTGEYKGFHVKYRIYGSSPEPASKVAAAKAKTVKKSPKLTPKRKVAKISKLKQAQGGIEHTNMNIEMQVPKPRHRRQYGRAQPNWDYNYAPQMPAQQQRPISRQNRFQAAAEATVTSRDTGPKTPKCRKGYPCPEEGTGYEEPTPQRKSSVLCIGCKEKKERSKNYLSYFIWFVVLAIFGGIGWYVYQTYFAADEERKKKEEEDEKKKEAEGNLGAATLARGGHKFADAPPRYESWQDHAQPLSTTGPPPPPAR